MASATSSPKNNEKIIFKCNQHETIITDKLRSFYEENEFFDTELIAGSDSTIIQAHRVVLCAMSDYFLQIFRACQSAVKSNVVELKEIEASTLKSIINYMYSGSIELCIETIEELLRTAFFLKIKTLVDGCCGLIEKNINSSNSLKTFRLAYELNLPNLKAKTLECTYTHFEDISKEKELLMLSENELMDVLFKDNPYGDFEEDLFLSMLAWINYDKSNREHHLFQLLSMVRYQNLTPKFIVENRKSVCKNVESYELICSWLQWHLSPETRSKDQKKINFKTRKMPDKVGVINLINGKQIKLETYKRKDNSWATEIEKSLPTKRIACSIIMIDGQLIVAGGYGSGSEWTLNVQYLDIQTLKWIDLLQMNSYRSRPQLVVLKEFLCIYGGNGIGTHSMEVHNISTKKLHFAQTLDHTSDSQIVAHNEILYSIDFQKGFLRSYNTFSNTWTVRIKVENNGLKDFGFCAVKGFLYVIGGSCQGTVLRTVKRYNLSDRSWCNMAQLPHARSNIKTTVVENKIIICDSCNFEEYNIDTDTWKVFSTKTVYPASVFMNLYSVPVLNK